MDPSKSIISIHKTVGTLAGHTRKLVIRVNAIEKIINNQSKKVTSLKNISKSQSERISGANIGAKLPGGTADNVNENIKVITDSLTSIAQILAGGKKLKSDTAAFDRRKAEQDKRALAESKLEKRFDGLKKIAEKVIAPVKNILDRIIDFLVTVFLGRVVFKLIEWFGDKKNADKVRSIIRFLGDHWPKLLALYLTFGTALGGLSRTLVSVVVRGAFLLSGAIAKLIGARKAARFLGGRGGKVASAVIGTGVTLAGTYALTQGMKGDGGDEQKTQAYRGGGFVIPKFSGGGFNFKGMLSGLFKKGFSGNSGGFISGEKGVDKVPAMLSDGEFVMSRGAVQKYGVDTLESMNAAGGGTNKPKIMSGTTYAQGGGYVGDKKSDGSDPILERRKKTAAQGQSFTQTSRAAAGLDDLAKKFDLDAKTAPRYAENLPKLNRPKPRIPRIDPSRMLPAAGGSSANAMRAAAKAAQNVRAPIPATSAIVPYTGGGLARTGVTGGLSVPQIRTNLNVPGGIGSLKSLGVELLLNYLMQKGLDYVEAKRIANQIEKANKGTPQKREAYITKLREIVDKEERYQKSFGGIIDKIIKLGGETGSEKMSRVSRDILGGLGAKTFQGGAIKGGYGLKGQSFKDMPKTQIMTDDKGKPFVGYKAMRGGKPVYVRGPKPGEGTTNPLEMLGRAINPGAYKDIDAANARKKYEEASAGSISSLKARGATQATIARRQAELNKRKPVAPPVKPAPKYTPAGGGMGGRRGGRGSGAGSGSQVPNIPMPKPSSAKAAVQGRNVRGGR